MSLAVSHFYFSLQRLFVEPSLPYCSLPHFDLRVSPVGPRSHPLEASPASSLATAAVLLVTLPSCCLV